MAAEQANNALARGEISQSQYDALQREIIETENNLRNLEQQADRSAVALQKIGAAGEKLQGVGSAIEGAGKKLMPVTAAVGGLGTAAVKVAADFDSAMIQVAAVSGVTGKDLEVLRDKAREMGSKRRLFERLADREIAREEFLERKKGYDAEIGRLEREISDAGLAERIERDADGEARERADVTRSFLDVGEMTEEIWERFVKGAMVYPDGRIEVQWNFGDEME